MNTLDLVTFGFLNTRDPIAIIFILALFALGIALPFRNILRWVGFYRPPLPRMVHVFAAIPETIVFRWLLLTYLIMSFEPLTAIIIAAVIYATFMNFVYGTEGIAEGLVTGIIFGLAFLQFGIAIVIFAHIVYRAIVAAW